MGRSRRRSLVEAMAEFSDVISLESCQGGEADAPDAYVT